MTRHAKSLLQEALTLPDSERAEIAGALLESLEPAAEADVEGAWKQEVSRRLAAVDSGKVETIPWEQLRDRLYSRLSPRQS